MIKRFISIIMTISILLSYSTVVLGTEVQDSEFEKRTKALIALGILEDDILIAESASVERGDFLKMVCNFFDVEHDSIEECAAFAESMGIIVSAEGYDYEREITFNEAVKMLVAATGFGSYAYLKGGYPNGYLDVARDIDLTKGIKSSEATASVLTELLYNALSTDIAKPISFRGESFTSEIIKNSGILSIWRNITKIEGTVTATDVTSLNGDDRLMDGDIAIDGEVYTVVGEYPENLIGLPVIAWVHDVDDIREVHYIEVKDKKFDVLEIAGMDIDNVPEDCSSVSYYKGDRLKTEDISPIVKVIYNGVLYKDYTRNDLMPQTGKLRLVDTDRDGEFDIVFVESYEIMLVDYVSLTNHSVTNIFNYVGALREMELDSTSDDYRFEMKKDGEDITLGSLKKYDVLNVARSKNGFNIKINVSAEPILGNVKSIDGSEQIADISVDEIETEFKISDVYYLAENQNTAGISKLQLSKAQYLYLDCYGRIVAVKDAQENDMQYVWAVRCKYYDEGLEPELSIKYLTADDDWVTTKIVDEKIRINGSRKKLEVAAGELGAGENFTHQLLMIKTNEDGIIKEIKTTTLSDTYIADTFTGSNKYTMTYRSPALYTSSNANVFYPSSGATVFLVPPTGTVFDEKNYIVMTGYFSYNRSYEVKAYNVDEFSCSDIFVVETTSSEKPVSTKNKHLLITKTGMKLTDDDEVLPYIKGDLGDYKNIELTISEHNAGIDPKNLNKGDYVVFDLDRSGHAVNIEKLIDYDSGIVKEEKKYRSTEFRVNSGVVTKVGSDNSMITLDYGTNTLPFKLPSACFLYDAETNTVSKATVADVSVGDYVVITRDGYSLTTNAAIIYKF